MLINTVEDFRKALVLGPYPWPGCYPVFFITSDGAALSFDAGKKEKEQIEAEIAEGTNCGFRVVACDVNWEDPALYCDHTGKRIESAYAEDDAEV